MFDTRYMTCILSEEMIKLSKSPSSSVRKYLIVDCDNKGKIKKYYFFCSKILHCIKKNKKTNNDEFILLHSRFLF